MRVKLQTGWLFAVMFAVTGVAMAQAPPPITPENKDAPAQAAPAKSAAPANSTATPAASAAPADPFAFPEEDSKKNNLGEEPVPVPYAPAPDASKAGGSAPASTAPDAHPYPGDPAHASPDGGGFSSSSDSAPGNPDAGTPDTRKKLDLQDAGSAGHIDTTRADKDEQVADFYEKTGNYQGAYLRYKDAVTYDPDDAYGHLRLAETARRLGKTAEATSEYTATVKLDPQSKEAKEAQKALAEMKPPAKKK